MENIKNKNFRNVTLGLQIAAVFFYFVPSLFIGGSVSLLWIFFGVLNTAMFCAVFYRNEKKRLALSIALSVVNILWCVFLAGFSALMLILELGLSFPANFNLYVLCALFAAIFALAAPRRYA
jgi:hypothetical protein